MTGDGAAGDRPAVTVLVVDDERGVLALAERVLSRAGYRVVARGAPQDALAWWEDAGQRDSVALVVSDVAMPGMTGHEMLQRMRATRPAIAALLVSGNLDDNTPSNARVPHSFLPKPYTPAQLVAAVEQALAVGPDRPGTA
jgi:two-component system cell cycle sensor histidine kinase/response regulator CckA